MKRLILPLVAALCLAGCHKHPSTFSTIAEGEPIIPIRMMSDTADVYLTDYLPMLLNEDPNSYEWIAGDMIEVIFVDSMRHFRMVNHDNAIHGISFFNEEEDFLLPILPNKPMHYGMLIQCMTGDEVTISFPTQGQHSVIALEQNRSINWRNIQENADGTWTIHLDHQHKGRSYLRVYAEDSTYLYNDLLIPLQDGHPITDAAKLNRHDHEAQILYSVMIDRFENGNLENDRPLNDPQVLPIADYMGGDIAGITRKIREGFFDSLSVNTLWISPITKNPDDSWGHYPFEHGNKYDSTLTYTAFSAYHGYWPIYTTRLDDHFATEDELKTLIETAHRHGINIIIDYVANHLHMNAPLYQQHPDWHTDSILPDGRRNFELWDEARLTTWFDTFLPTLDLEREEVRNAMVDSALYWVEHYDIDGFRHDACKHIPEAYWRLFTSRLMERYPKRDLWMIGETYGSPQLINQYVRTGMLDAQFDFNLYWAARDAFCYGESMERIDATIRESLRTYGCHHTMGNISGNHDQVRLASLADGAVGRWESGKEAGWTRYVSPASELAYIRTMQLMVLNLTLPGVPCIYQGDEYAEIGANDPDNRHMMRFGGLSPREQQFRDKVKMLTDLRRGSMALLYGEYIPIEATQDTLVYARAYGSQRITVKIIRDKESEITINE